eukprot:1194550-Prorocentrum_minimum.AAC.6
MNTHTHTDEHTHPPAHPAKGQGKRALVTGLSAESAGEVFCPIGQLGTRAQSIHRRSTAAICIGRGKAAQRQQNTARLIGDGLTVVLKLHERNAARTNMRTYVLVSYIRKTRSRITGRNRGRRRIGGSCGRSRGRGATPGGAAGGAKVLPNQVQVRYQAAGHNLAEARDLAEACIQVCIQNQVTSS